MGEVLYRRWRPQRFAELVGQEAVTRTLLNAVAQGRVSHAYLFCGPRGTGKTTAGRLLAKAVNCLAPQEGRPEGEAGEPCNRCGACQDFLQGRSLDLIEMDAASNRGIDEVRRLRERVGLAAVGLRKVYLIDEVHMLTTEANNALLKTLEEPPPHVIFILATTEPHKVPATIISRCQRFDFRRLLVEVMVGRLAYIGQQEGFAVEREALEVIAGSATGSLRDAINTLEQLVAYYGPSLGLAQAQEALGLASDERAKALVRHLLGGDLAAGLKVIAAAREEGVDMRQWQRQVVEHLRELVHLQATAEGGPDPRLAATPPERLWRALRSFAGADLRADSQSSLPLELALAECLLGEAEAVPKAGPASPGRRAAPEEMAPKRADLPAASPRPGPPLPARAPAAPRSEEPPPPAAPAGAPADDFLKELRLACKKVNVRVAALLNGSCQVESLTEDALTLGFFRTFHKENVEAPESRQLVEEVASRLLGRRVTLRCVMTEARAGPRSPGRPEAGFDGGHLLRAAREMGARPLRPSQPATPSGSGGWPPRS